MYGLFTEVEEVGGGEALVLGFDGIEARDKEGRVLDTSLEKGKLTVALDIIGLLE